MGEAEKAPKAKRRWYQYRLAHLFIFVTICAIPCSWFACRMVAANKRKEAVEAIEEFDGIVLYDYEFGANGDLVLDAEPPSPAWFCNLVGVDFLQTVTSVTLVETKFSAIKSVLPHLKQLPDLNNVLLLADPANTEAKQLLKDELPGVTVYEASLSIGG